MVQAAAAEMSVLVELIDLAGGPEISMTWTNHSPSMALRSTTIMATSMRTLKLRA